MFGYGVLAPHKPAPPAHYSPPISPLTPPTAFSAPKPLHSSPQPLYSVLRSKQLPLHLTPPYSVLRQKPASSSTTLNPLKTYQSHGGGGFRAFSRRPFTPIYWPQFQLTHPYFKGNFEGRRDRNPYLARYFQ